MATFETVDVSPLLFPFLSCGSQINNVIVVKINQDASEFFHPKFNPFANGILIPAPIAANRTCQKYTYSPQDQVYLGILN